MRLGFSNYRDCDNAKMVVVCTLCLTLFVAVCVALGQWVATNPDPPQRDCSNHGGFRGVIDRYADGKVFHVVCKDGAIVGMPG